MPVRISPAPATHTTAAAELPAVPRVASRKSLQDTEKRLKTLTKDVHQLRTDSLKATQWGNRSADPRAVQKELQQRTMELWKSFNGERYLVMGQMKRLPPGDGSRPEARALLKGLAELEKKYLNPALGDFTVAISAISSKDPAWEASISRKWQAIESRSLRALDHL